MCAFLNKLDDKVLSGGVEKSSWGHHLLQTQILSPFLPPGSYTCQRKGRAVSIGLGALAPKRVLFIKGHSGHGQGSQEQQHPPCRVACPPAPRGYPLLSVATWAPSRFGGFPGPVRSCVGQDMDLASKTPTPATDHSDKRRLSHWDWRSRGHQDWGSTVTSLESA